jgi:prolyl 4-hydroxylase
MAKKSNKKPSSTTVTERGENKKNQKQHDDDVLLNNIAATDKGSSSSAFSLKYAVLLAVLSVIVGIFLTYQVPSAGAPRADPAKSKSTKRAETGNAVPTSKLSVAQIKQRAKTMPCKDRHDSDSCAQHASRGDCDVSVGWMTVMCAASCNRCELRDPKKRCTEENMGIKFDDAYRPGDLDAMFESLATRDDIKVLNRKPWMVLVRNFITEKESSTLLRLTEKGLKRSTDQGEIGDDGFQEQVVSNYRTSSNSWCGVDCETNPTVMNLMERIAELVRIPTQNFESFQVLRYEKTQKYDVHHDGSANDFHMAAGPRVLTFFMYLSDVEEGGETHFPKLNITVRPEKGSALLWPSVQSDFPNSKLEQMTYHAALPVKRGTKYAANSWIHLRDYKTPNLWGCTGSFD